MRYNVHPSGLVEDILLKEKEKTRSMMKVLFVTEETKYLHFLKSKIK